LAAGTPNVPDARTTEPAAAAVVGSVVDGIATGSVVGTALVVDRLVASEFGEPHAVATIAKPKAITTALRTGRA
jgi:hypothetical protein